MYGAGPKYPRHSACVWNAFCSVSDSFPERPSGDEIINNKMIMNASYDVLQENTFERLNVMKVLFMAHWHESIANHLICESLAYSLYNNSNNEFPIAEEWLKIIWNSWREGRLKKRGKLNRTKEVEWSDSGFRHFKLQFHGKVVRARWQDGNFSSHLLSIKHFCQNVRFLPTIR